MHSLPADADGNYVQFNAAKGVILATGDFGANTDMVWELCSECAENAMRHGVDREMLTGMTDCDIPRYPRGIPS